MGITQSFSSLANITAAFAGAIFSALYPPLVFLLSSISLAIAFCFLKNKYLALFQTKNIMKNKENHD